MTIVFDVGPRRISERLVLITAAIQQKGLPLVTKGKACLIHRCSLITAVLCCKPRGLLAFLISGALPVAHTFRFWPIKQKLSAAHHSQCCHSMTPLFFVELRLAITTFLSPDISCCLRLILVAYKLKL